MKDDETKLLRLVYENQNLTPRAIMNSGIGIHHKRCRYFLDKWSDKDWYDYGVSVDLGWLTNKGIEVAKELPPKGENKDQCD